MLSASIFDSSLGHKRKWSNPNMDKYLRKSESSLRPARSSHGSGISMDFDSTWFKNGKFPAIFQPCLSYHCSYHPGQHLTPCHKSLSISFKPEVCRGEETCFRLRYSLTLKGCAENGTSSNTYYFQLNLGFGWRSGECSGSNKERGSYCPKTLALRHLWLEWRGLIR